MSSGSELPVLVLFATGSLPTVIAPVELTFTFLVGPHTWSGGIAVGFRFDGSFCCCQSPLLLPVGLPIGPRSVRNSAGKIGRPEGSEAVRQPTPDALTLTHEIAELDTTVPGQPAFSAPSVSACSSL